MELQIICIVDFPNFDHKAKDEDFSNFLNITPNLKYDPANENLRSSLNICCNGFLFIEFIGKTELFQYDILFQTKNDILSKLLFCNKSNKNFLEKF